LPDFNAGNSIGEALIKNPPNAAPIPESTFAPGHLSQFMINQFDEFTGLAIYDEKKIVRINLKSGQVNDLLSLPDGSKVSSIKFDGQKNLLLLTQSGKTSQLWKITSERTVPVSTATTSNKPVIPNRWSISLTIMFIGLLATYLVYHNQQKHFGV
jgi:hypothetical protein